ncbi:MAG: hypothetical protein V4503_01620 [Gemmatimonadota bacterium]
MDGNRSTGTLFLYGAKAGCGFLLGWWVLDRFLWPGQQTLMWALWSAGLLALLTIAHKYWQPEWKCSTAPQHILGLGMASTAVVIVWFLSLREDASLLDTRRVAVGLAALGVPFYLMIAGARQVRLRAVRHSSSGPK